MPLPCSKKDGKSGLAVRVGRGSVSNENNVLLDPDVLTDYPTQVLVLTVLVSVYCIGTCTFIYCYQFSWFH